MERLGLSLFTLALALGLPSGASAEGGGFAEVGGSQERLVQGRGRTFELLDAWRASPVIGDGSAKASPACADNPRPTYSGEKVYDDATYKFRIHYTLNSADPRSVTEEDVTRTAESMRWVIDTQKERLGYDMPPGDSVDSLGYCDEGFGGNGGNAYYDIYFVDEDFVYGYAQPMSLTSATGLEATSFLALSTWILNRPGDLEVTVAHEFFHAVQFGYDVFEDSFWMENTATWMEEEVYDSVNDYYNYLPEAFQNPGARLSARELAQYAHAIWPLFMRQETKVDVVKEIWEECAKSDEANALGAQKVVLDKLYDGGWEAAVVDFRGAMYNRDRFAEGEAYPEVSATITVTSLPASASPKVDNTGAGVIILNADTLGVSDDTLNICFEGGSDAVRARVYGRQASDQDPLPFALSPSDDDGCLAIEGFGSTYDEVAIIGTYASTQLGSKTFTYSACLSSASACSEEDVTEPGSEGEVIDEEGATPEESPNTGGGGGGGGDGDGGGTTDDEPSTGGQGSFAGAESGGSICGGDDGDSASLLFLWGHLLIGLRLRRRPSSL